MAKIKNLTGKTYNGIKAIHYMGKTKKGHTKWLFRCWCGKYFVSIGSNVTRNHTKSCGCLKTKHGLYHTRLHHIWNGIKERCLNKNDPHYKRYGEIGISVCSEWKESFKVFYDWATKNGYQDNLSIDRIDNSKGYFPENCRWSTAKEQANNKTNNNFVTYNGETHTERQWEYILNLPRGTFYNRKKLGWDVKKIIETPIKETIKRKND